MKKTETNPLTQLLNASREAFSNWQAAESAAEQALQSAQGNRKERARMLIAAGQDVDTALATVDTQDADQDAASLKNELAEERFMMSVRQLAPELKAERDRRLTDAHSAVTVGLEHWAAGPGSEFDADLRARIFPHSASYREAVLPAWHKAASVPVLSFPKSLPPEFELLAVDSPRREMILANGEPLTSPPTRSVRRAINGPGDWAEFLDTVKAAL